MTKFQLAVVLSITAVMALMASGMAVSLENQVKWECRTQNDHRECHREGTAEFKWFQGKMTKADEARLHG